MISYEVIMGLTVLGLIVIFGTVDLNSIVQQQSATVLGVLPAWGIVLQPFAAILFMVAAVAENKRIPFDLPEAESELVAGHLTEYSAMTFGLFFLGEYANMILMSGLTSVLFLGGWLPPIDIAPFNWLPGPIWFILKICALLFLFVWVRATFPRYRYDQLMRLGWKVFLPLSLLWLVLTAAVLMVMGWAPGGAA